MKNQIQLIAYVDRLGCKDIAGLKALCKTRLKGMVGAVHLLPFYSLIDGEDAGFDPINHEQIDPRLGDWSDLKSLGEEVDIMADVIVNHMSAESAQFLDYLEKGDQSEFADLFLSFSSVFPNGATEQDIMRIYRPRPSLPFTMVEFKDGSSKLVWTTFTSNQIDIDVTADSGQAYLERILKVLKDSGVTSIRLDAAGYAIKKAGSSCFMIDETFDFIDTFTAKAHALGVEVLVEIHSYYKTQIEIASRVDYVYDFALPVLVLDTLFNKDSSNLKKWLAVSPRNAITVLDTHDGIGVVDVASEDGKPGLIDDAVLTKIVDQIHDNCNGESRKATGAAASNLDLYQVNCTFYSALGQDDKAYIIARAIQFFVPGVPQVYYVGMFAGANDMDLLERSQVGRDINRHYFTEGEVAQAFDRPVVQELRQLMIDRNTHPAFNGVFELVETLPSVIHIRWTREADVAELIVDLASMDYDVKLSALS